MNKSNLKESPIAESLQKKLVRALGKAAGTKAAKSIDEASEDYFAGRYPQAKKKLEPLIKEAPSIPEIRELYGICLYSLGDYKDATKELEAFKKMAKTTEQNPVLADCHRALGNHLKVAELWKQLKRNKSATPEMLTEGRIVYAGSLADQGKTKEAIALLNFPKLPQTPKPHHILQVYALADLQEKSGDIMKSGRLFEWVAAEDQHELTDAASRTGSN